jgi:hypothetical protein
MPRKRSTSKKADSSPAPKGRGRGKAPETLDEAIRSNPRLAQLLAFAVVNAGNISAAAREAGLSESYARRLVGKYPELRERVNQRIQENAEAVVSNWQDMHTRALNRASKLLDSTDERVALGAIQMVVERVEGRVPQKIEAEVNTSEVSQNSVQMRFVTSLHMAQGVSIAEAMHYAQQHPEEVEEWGRRQGLLQPD